MFQVFGHGMSEHGLCQGGFGNNAGKDEGNHTAHTVLQHRTTVSLACLFPQRHLADLLQDMD